MSARLLLAAAVGMVVAASGRADTVTLTSSATPGSPLVTTAGGVSTAVQFQINNVPSGPAATLSAWQLSLVIAPIGGVSGTLTFNSPTTQTFTPPAGQPPSYLLNGNSVGIAATNGGTTLRANDFANTSVTIPAGLSNLLQVDFLASPTAGGTFGVYAVRGSAETVYTDGAATDAFFSNVPMGVGTVELFRVFVVPEPASCLAVAVAAGLLGRAARRHGRAARNRAPVGISADAS